MSLKAFHIIFVAASISVSLFFGIWSFLTWRESGGSIYLGYTGASAIAIGVLIWYGKYFLKKLKHISYL